MSETVKSILKVADEVWVAAATLHRARPTEFDFSIAEILGQANELSQGAPLRPGVYVHILQHCVANRPPNPGRYRMLYETADGRRRLYRRGDPYHAARDGAKMTPAPEDMPSEHFNLLAWYEEWISYCAAATAATDPLLALRGSGKELWADEPADVYVNNLRDGWDGDE